MARVVKPPPKGLPPVKKEVRKSKGRDCPKCGQECRVISNDLGVRMHCVRCKEFYPISRALNPTTSPAAYGPRPIIKQTLVEPDWDSAYESDEEYEYENVRRKDWEEG